MEDNPFTFRPMTFPSEPPPESAVLYIASRSCHTEPVPHPKVSLPSSVEMLTPDFYQLPGSTSSFLVQPRPPSFPAVLSGMLVARNHERTPVTRQRSFSAPKSKPAQTQAHWEENGSNLSQLAPSNTSLSLSNRLQSSLLDQRNLPSDLEIFPAQASAETRMTSSGATSDSDHEAAPSGGVFRASDFDRPSSDSTSSSRIQKSYPTQMSRYEYELERIALKLMEDKTINPFEGSLPIEKIQNILKQHYANLYHNVVGNFHRSWWNFVKRHNRTFELFAVDDGKWRMRLLWHTNFRIGDAQLMTLKEVRVHHILHALSFYLQTFADRSCAVDDFFEAYPEISFNQTQRLRPSVQFPLMYRGDFVKLVKRYPEHFKYDKSNYMITLLQALC